MTTESPRKAQADNVTMPRLPLPDAFPSMIILPFHSQISVALHYGWFLRSTILPYIDLV